ncbi:MAG: AMP-binding protein [Gammaproteobacteria bacterium]|nr:AMP-binding protein [Gammaproteobacteria bacterium]
MPLDKSSWTLVGLARRQADSLGDSEFIRFEQGTRLTFAGLDTDSDNLALNLAGLGVVPGDRVFALLKNRAEFMLAMLATMKLGAIFVPVNTELKGAFLQHQLTNTEPRVVFVDAGLINAFAGIEGGTANLSATICVAGDVAGVLPSVLSGSPSMTFEALSLSVPVLDDDVLVEPGPEDIACIIYTSGTTGPAKGVLMPHAHCYLFGRRLVERLSMTAADCQYVCMPLFHTMGLLLQVVSSWISGGRVYCIERFSPNRWLDDIRSCEATVTNALGVMPEFIFRTAETEHDRDHRLSRILAVPIAADWGSAFEERFGIKFFQGYGMTEINLICYTSDDDPLTPGLAGKIADDFFEVQIVDAETDLVVSPGEIGEIVVRPKEPFCFSQGYFRMPEKTVETWRNLWFHTGDAGRFDERGRLYFVDRIRDRIRRRGENISSFEIEQVLNEHPEVIESAVVGIRVDDAGGEDEVKAIIVTEDGVDIDNVALLNYCAEHMPRFAVPRFVEAVKELSKTATGKIQKEPLRKLGVSEHTWDRESVGYQLPRR